MRLTSFARNAATAAATAGIRGSDTATTVIATAAAAEQENQNNDDPKTVVAVSAEHKHNLSPHGRFDKVAVSIVRKWKHMTSVMFG